MSSRTVTEWERTTALVEGPATTGTGFFLADIQGARLYLVTCKHLIGETANERAAADHVRLHINRQDPNQNLQPINIPYPLHSVGGQLRWREHPDEHVDVLVINVTELALQQDLAIGARPLDIIATANALSQLQVGIGDKAAIIGYPQLKKQEGTNLPIFRYGHISSPVFGSVRALYPGNPVQAVVPGFWLDGVMVPGSSGSPVVLVSERLVSHAGAAVVVSTRPMLLGIVAKAEYSAIPPQNQPAYAGLSVVHHAQTVVEVIALF